MKPKHNKIGCFEPLILLSASATDGSDVIIDINEGTFVGGEGGDDFLIAFAGGAQMYGGEGDDWLISIRGVNFMDGGEGQDKLVYFANRSDYTFQQTSGESVSVHHKNGVWTDTIMNIERVRFDDGEFTLDELLGEQETTEYRSFDGTGNNPNDYEMGSSDEPLKRLTSAQYEDGVSAPAGTDRPDARTVSNMMAEQTTTQANSRGLTDMVWLWGQFIDHDISLTESAEPHENMNIQVPAGEPIFDPNQTGAVEMNFNRSAYEKQSGGNYDDPRQQVNQITAYIDGGMVYGSDDVRAAELRSFEGGLLRIGDDNLLIMNDAGLPNSENGPEPQLFLAGDVRANENVALTSMQTLWVREHNRVAAELALDSPLLNDEELFQRSRAIVVAEIQAITYNDFLPALIGNQAIAAYEGYDSTVDVTVATEFSTAAYRFGHSMLASELLRIDKDGNIIEAGNLALQDAFFAPQEILNNGIDSLLMGAASQAANEVDNQIVDGVRNFLFGPPGAGGFDLAALNIQRGRDHGIPDYNTVRGELGLGPVTDFDEITVNVDVQNRLRNLYGSVDKIDLWVGGLAEDHLEGSSMGETFHMINSDQFMRLRNGDRFWYQNVFEGDQLAEIESTTLSDVIERNTTANNLQDNVFFLPEIADS